VLAHCVSHSFLYNGHLHVRGLQRLRTERLYNIKMSLVTSIMILFAFEIISASDDY
jgi:hypothetical protein